MRDKESGDNERKTQTKLLDKQERFVRAAQEAESAAKLRAVRLLEFVKKRHLASYVCCLQDTLYKELLLERDRADYHARQAMQSALETDTHRTQAEVNLQKLEEVCPCDSIPKLLPVS